ncbi:YdeI/OmpD-associated family protein [Secundilactobacillus oryzae]|nr:YdeI/OmpD-associated family protein [Secundilactobacillus oryzae]
MTFALSLDEMKQQIEAVNRDKLLAQSGYLYIAYPKVQSKHYDGVRRDDIFPYLHVDETTGQMGETHLKFSWMLKLDEDFTLVGLQWLTAAPRQQNKPSQRVADCEGRLPELEEMLATYPSTLQQFRELTPGYRREWARYVFSPRTAATQASHFDKMIEVLEAGYSSVELYRQAQS